ncbi:MAG: hypothetical protein KIT57_12440 [Blastocatellales bacterium]|nr:hypothetical protein [Blastocatellales bacterium]
MGRILSVITLGETPVQTGRYALMVVRIRKFRVDNRVSDLLISDLTRPQQRHLVNFCDSLLVCETEKTPRSNVNFSIMVNVSNWGRLSRISPGTTTGFEQS